MYTQGCSSHLSIPKLRFSCYALGRVHSCMFRAVHPICPYPHSAFLVSSWGLLRDSAPCVVKIWRFGRPVLSVEITFTRPNPVGDVTKCCVDTSVLSLRHAKQANWAAVWFVFYDTGA